MEKELISIIVPIYNVEEFLPKCIETLVNQIYKNIEILLIDDGSTDKSGELSDKYANEYENVTVYHKANGGLSDARNYGIDRAKGKYICFVDSDDYVDKKYCEILYNNLVNTESDISICGFERTGSQEEKNIDYSQEKITTYADSLEMQRNILILENEFNTVTTVAWNKLYKKEIWQDIRYPKGKINEDEFVIQYLLEKCNKIVYTNLNLYYYYQRDNSIIKSNYNKRKLDGVDAFKERFEFYKNTEKYNSLASTMYVRYMKLIIYHYIQAKKAGLKDVSEQMQERYKKEYENNLGIKIDSTKDRWQLKTFLHMPKLYSILKSATGRE